MSLRSSRIAVETISALLILLFVYTALSKLYAPDNFRAPVAQSPLLAKYAGLIVWAVPTIELVTSALLLYPPWRQQGFLFSAILMTLFTLYIAYILLFAKELPCSCGGVIAQLSWPQHLLFNIFFTSLAYTGWNISRKITPKAYREKLVKAPFLL